LISAQTRKSFEDLYIKGYNKEYPSIELVRLQKALFKNKNKKILDYGSGHGANGIHFLKHGFEVTFCDISKKSIEDLKKKIKKLKKKNSNFIYLENYSQLKENYINKFDVIICMSVINNLHSINQIIFLLNLFYNMLKLSGYLIIDTNYIKNNYKVIKKINKNTILTSLSNDNKKILKMFFPSNKKEFIKIIKKTNFKIIDIGHYSFKILNNFEREDIFTLQKS